MLRTILAVLAGVIIWTILWLGANAVLTAAMPGAFRADGSIASNGLLAVILVLSGLISLVAGYSTARLASAHEMSHALALGGVLFLIGLFAQSQYWEVLPLWYHLTFLALLIPATWLGGKLRLGQKMGLVSE